MKNTKGFTLIELLVVITIIGILATGASTVYTSAQQKARDSIRQTDVMALKSSIEQSYGDQGKYLKPSDLIITTAGGAGLVPNGYMTALPKDPKSLTGDGKTFFVYVYGAARDEATGVPGQIYEISANFENGGNKGKETGDGGNDESNPDGATAAEKDIRWEVGVSVNKVDTTTIGTAGKITALTDITTMGTNAYEDDTEIPSVMIDSIPTP